MALLDAGDPGCTTGIAKRIYDQLTADVRNGFSAPLSAAQEDAVKSICYAAAKGVADEVNADGGLGGGGLSGAGADGRFARWLAGALTDSGLFLDGAGRLSLPVGLAFPGGSTLDAAPAAGVSGGGTTGNIPQWTGPSALGDSEISVDGSHRLVLPSGGALCPDGSVLRSGWTPLDKDVVGYWPLDEEQGGGGAFDSARQYPMTPNAGTLTGPGLDTSGPSGRRARSFDGAAQYLNATMDWNSIYAGFGSWTIEGWAKPSSTATNPLTIWRFGVNTSGNGGMGRVLVGKPGGSGPGTLNVQWQATSTTQSNANQTTGTVLTFDAWNHFAVRLAYQRASNTYNVDLFVNNALQQSFTGLTAWTKDSFTGLLTIGNDQTNTGLIFKGSLSMIRFSRKARSNQEISDYFNNCPTLG